MAVSATYSFSILVSVALAFTASKQFFAKWLAGIFFGKKIKKKMASGIFAVLDDIAALMDDVAVASKLATKKTAGILGDDLAVNAEKATGFLSSREIPVLWKITKGSFLNKLIIVPLVFLLQAIYPKLIPIILVIGGFYLAYEGVEKIIHFLFFRKKNAKEVVEEIVDSDMELEKKKVRSAISTDFILSLEIVIIALSQVLDKSLLTQILAVSVVALVATVGVYGLVALIVRMDDLGYRLIRLSKERGLVNRVGIFLVKALPVVIKSLSVIGTIALILVSGEIFLHNVGFLHDFLSTWPELLRIITFGLLGGILALPAFFGLKKLAGIWIKPKPKNPTR